MDKKQLKKLWLKSFVDGTESNILKVTDKFILVDCVSYLAIYSFDSNRGYFVEVLLQAKNKFNESTLNKNFEDRFKSLNNPTSRLNVNEKINLIQDKKVKEFVKNKVSYWESQLSSSGLDCFIAESRLQTFKQLSVDDIIASAKFNMLPTKEGV